MSDPFALPPVDDVSWVEQSNGLKTWDVVVGTGTECPAKATVKVHYTGWLTNGKVFDSSKKRGEPISFGLHQVIQGWTLGVPGMKIGGTRRLLIPPEMGYGSRGAGASIPPNAVLVFEIELLDVK